MGAPTIRTVVAMVAAAAETAVMEGALGVGRVAARWGEAAEVLAAAAGGAALVAMAVVSTVVASEGGVATGAG